MEEGRKEEGRRGVDKEGRLNTKLRHTYVLSSPVKLDVSKFCYLF